MKANLQAQVATLKSRQMSLEQQVQVSCTSLESEKSRCRALGDDIEVKSQTLLTVQREVEVLKVELEVMTKKAQENSNHVRILASSCNESKVVITAKEKVGCNIVYFNSNGMNHSLVSRPRGLREQLFVLGC